MRRRPASRASTDTADSPDFDPGGASTDLPSDAPPVPQLEAPSAAGDDDAAPLDQEPANDVDAPVADAGDDPAGPNAQQPAAPATPPAPPSGGDPEQPAPPTSPARPRTRLRQRPLRRARRARTPVCDSGRTSAERTRRGRRRSSSPEPVSRRAPLPPVPPPTPPRAHRARPPAFRPVQARPTSSVAVAVGDRDAAARGDRTHVARPGRVAVVDRQGRARRRRRRPPRSRAR